MPERQIGDVMFRYKVSTYDYQGRVAYRLAECKSCDRSGVACPMLHEAAVGELVHYYEGDGPEDEHPTVIIRVMYEPYEGDPILIK